MAAITVLGAGLVGSVIARDLAGKHDVTSADLSLAALGQLKEQGIRTVQLDLTDTAAIRKTVADADVVVSAVPSVLGYQVLKTLVEDGKAIADIAFTPEEILGLHDLAVSTGARLLTDIGVAPGISNLILGHHDQHMKVSKFVCYVGGVPQVPAGSFEYKAPFAPSDVVEEYTRPARFQVGGKVVEKPALSDLELVEFENVGKLEAFNTDGLRSILTTMAHIPEMIEKTMRWPGHTRIMQAMSDAGFFSEQPVTVNGVSIRPLDLSVKLLSNAWQMTAADRDMLVMRVVVEGEERGRRVRHTWETRDDFDEQTGFSAMSRMTGFTCAAAANLLAENLWQQPGVYPAELVGEEDACFDSIMGYLRERGVRLRRETRDL